MRKQIKARQWHQPDHMQIICILLQIDNHANTLSLDFYRSDALPDAQPTTPRHWETIATSSINTHTCTPPFNGPFSATTRVSRYQKGETNLDFTEARDSEWQWHQLVPFWYRLTWVVPEKGPLNVCSSVDNTAKENSSVFFLIRMCWLPSARACQNFSPTKSSSS